MNNTATVHGTTDHISCSMYLFLRYEAIVITITVIWIVLSNTTKSSVINLTKMLLLGCQVNIKNNMKYKKSLEHKIKIHK